MTSCSPNKAAIANNLTPLYYIDCPQGNLPSHWKLTCAWRPKKLKKTNPTHVAEYGFRVRFVIPIKSKCCSTVRYYIRRSGPLEPPFMQPGLKALPACSWLQPRATFRLLQPTSMPRSQTTPWAAQPTEGKKSLTSLHIPVGLSAPKAAE